MDSRGRAVAAVVLVVLVTAAAAIFLDTNGDLGQPDLEERYLAVHDYDGTMRTETTVVGPTENTTFFVENDTGAFVENGSLSPDDSRLQGPPTVISDNGSVTVREFRPVTANGTEGRTVRAVTRRGRGTIANSTVVARVRYRRPDSYRYDYRIPPEPDLVTVVLEGANATRYERGGRVTETETARLGVETIGVRIGDVVRNFSERYSVEPAGTATVAGREARVFALTPTAAIERPVDRLWIDRETELPVRVRATRRSGDRNTTITVTYRNMSYDTGLADDAFTVDEDALPARRSERAAGERP